MNEKDLLHTMASELISIWLAAVAGVMWGVRKLVGMDRRISAVEASVSRFEAFRQETDEKLDELMTDVATIKSDTRHNAETSQQILQLLQRNR